MKLLYNIPIKWQFNFQDPASSAMEKIIDLHNDIMVFLVFIMFFISWMLIRTIVLFNSDNINTIRFSFQHHTFLEQIWTIIPAVILLMIATPSFALLYAMDELRDPKLTIHCIGNQWFWSYNYPDYTLNQTIDNFKNEETISFDSYMITEDNLTIGSFRLLEVDNQVHLPIKQSIRLLISSRDVLHSWSVPSLGIKMDGCPGRTNQVALFLTRKGIFYGQCSELCGVQHAFMPIVIRGESLSKFLMWINSFQ